jgi:hypothetical protein
MANFEVGQQPCKDFRPMPGFLGGANVHECFCGFSKGKACSKLVSFCENCNRDHHEEGYENCICEGRGFNQ